MNNEKQAFLMRLFKFANSLKITKTIHTWTIYKGHKDIVSCGTIKELEGLLSKYKQPYDTMEMYRFLKGELLSITLSNGDFEYLVNISKR